MVDDFNALENIIHYRFKEVNLLKLALTHSSFANETQEQIDDNERLEFLGDAVLELCVSEELIRRFPSAGEGFLTRLRSRMVSASALAEKARSLQLDKLLLLGRGEEQQGGRERGSLLSDGLEALLGAVFLDGGYDAARQTVLRLYEKDWLKELELDFSKDFKSRLQEICQKKFKARPVYVLKDSQGPEHSKIFEVLLSLPDGNSVLAVGASVKKAEQKAARQALERFFAGEEELK